MDLLSFVVALAAVLIGAVGQRMIGMGWGLVVTPAVALVAGPLAAVLVVNLYGAIACLIILPRVWRDIDWRRLLWIAIPALAVMVPGMLLAKGLDTDLLRVAVGAIAVLGVLVAVAFTSATRTHDGPALRVASGTAIGLLNASVGMGAPAVGAYSLLSGWQDRTFVATMQPFWVLISGAVVAVRPLVAPEGSPEWPLWAWFALALPVVAGVLLGDRLAHLVNPTVVRWTIIALSVLGGGALIVTGTLGLLG
ncbi:sulfite exporter TauE/SafE family protein [Agrococcus sediminis]|uniref:Probable membrane transporter protein n=1 Tax=Agrococcus sediminis TaxID=2599924 RepID=A0A5M8QER2_9MICO|nr:sulfite exporter TauE/SafE family protein [Agrococcus sediminis]KAA6432872.1 sulfite exporter TauE/SafE family protein [Agrococcus sediminis]RWR23829.1 sulfite exporter TauE/SafE family protein [Agrococcus lahaulensis]